MGQSEKDLLEELQALTDKLKAFSLRGEGSRNLSLAITNLEYAEDKLYRHVRDGK